MYSAIGFRQFHHPRNSGPLEDATLEGLVGTLGIRPYMQVWLFIADGIIRKAGYRTYGTPAAIACGSVMTELITNHTVDFAAALDADELIRLLGGLPERKQPTATLAIEALREALSSPVLSNEHNREG